MKGLLRWVSFWGASSGRDRLESGRMRRARRASGWSVEGLESREVMSTLPLLLVIADQQDFYYKEYNDTRQALEGAGVPVVVAATTTNPSTPHPNTGQVPSWDPGTVTPDIALADVEPTEYSGIAFVGGWGSSMYQYAYNDPNFDGTSDNFYSNAPYNGDSNLNDGIVAPQKVLVNSLINEFLADDKPVGAICHGVTVLAWARVDGVSPLAGRTVAVPHTVGSPNQFYNGQWWTYPANSLQYDQVVANGGIANTVSGQYGDPNTVADDVVVDGRIITAENYDTAARFGEVLAAEIQNAVAPPTVTQFAVTYGNGKTYDLLTSSRYTLPWAITGVQATFSTPVTANMASLQMTGSGAPTVVSMAGSGSTTVSWVFHQPVKIAKLNFFLKGSGPNAIMALASGRALDGNGDAVAGDDLAQSTAVLLGDFSNDGYIKSNDILWIHAAIGSSSLYADINGDGIVNAQDRDMVRPRVGTRLPT